MTDPASLLPPGRTRETKIRRDAEGRWFNDDAPITHSLLSHAFDEWLVPAPDGSGRWALSNSINWAFVAIEGPPRFVRRVVIEGEQVRLHLSNGEVAPLDPATLRQGPEGALYCEVGGLVARFDRSAMMQLEARIGEDERGVYVEVGAGRVHPPVVLDPLA